MPTLVCPTCRAAVAKTAENKAFPFCGERCQLLDLGGWLDERYRIAGSSQATDSEDDSELSDPN